MSCRNTSVFRTWLVVSFVINEAELNTVDNLQVIQGIKGGKKRENQCCCCCLRGQNEKVQC